MDIVCVLLFLEEDQPEIYFISLLSLGVLSSNNANLLYSAITLAISSGNNMAEIPSSFNPNGLSNGIYRQPPCQVDACVRIYL